MIDHSAVRSGQLTAQPSREGRHGSPRPATWRPHGRQRLSLTGTVTALRVRARRSGPCPRASPKRRSTRSPNSALST